MNQKSFELWKQRIAERKASGLNVTNWCEKNNLSKNAYYYWLKCIGAIKQNADTSMPVFVEIEPAYLASKQTVKSALQITWSNINIVILIMQSVQQNLSTTCRNYVKSLSKRCIAHIYIYIYHMVLQTSVSRLMDL